MNNEPPVQLRCVADHVWTGSGACPVCGGDAVDSRALSPTQANELSTDGGGARGDKRDACPTSESGEFSTDGGGSAQASRRGGRFPEIPNYAILDEIGAGGMGVVYRARHINLGREVALKVIASGELAQAKDQKRFVMEAEMVARLKHPNIVQVHDVGVVDGRPYFTMELISGPSLAQRLEKESLSFSDAARLCSAIARAAECAHRQGIVHRDLKPANILYTEDGTPKLVDFGVAKQLTASDGLTETGKPIGTPQYMAPEQASSSRVIGPGVDVHAIGAILYRLLAGRVPFDGDFLYDIMHRIITTEPVSPAWYRPETPRDLELICLKCLEKDPARRYATAAQLADDLDRFLNNERISIGWTPPWRRFTKWCRRNPALATAAASVLLTVSLIAAFWVFYVPSTTTTVVEDEGMKLRREEVTKRAETYLRNAPQPDRESPHPVTIQADLPKPDLSAFEVLTDDRIVDLRGWRLLAASEPGAVSTVIFHNRRTLLKVAETATYETEFRTSGRDLFVRAHTPNRELARVLASDTPGLVGGQALKVRQVSMDVSTEPVGREFTAECQATLVDSMQTPEEQWIGLIGFKDSLRSSMLILFPADRPFKTYQLMVAPKGDAPPEPFTGPRICIEGANHQWLYWEVGNPEDDLIYRIDWTW